jgi:hypothetical protein
MVDKVVEDVSSNSPDRVRELKQLIRSIGGRHGDPISARDVVSVAIANARHTLPEDNESLMAILSHQRPSATSTAIRDKF